MRKIILYQHAGSFNHGCEALVLTIVNLLSQILNDDCSFCIVSGDAASDMKYSLDSLPNSTIVSLNKKLHRFSLNWFILQFAKFLGLNSLQNRLRYNTEWMDDSALYIAIGGDNYCYNKGKGFYDIDNMIHGKRVLWGCSIEPDDLDDELCEHLRLFSVITTRESITYNALVNKGFNNVFLIPDTAFSLPTKQVEKLEGEYFGINISPMILRYSNNSDVVIDNYLTLIKYIVDNTDMKLIFIPHVCENGNDDRVTMRKLTDGIPPERIKMVDEMNCMELKGYIGQCRFFIGARTHSTIAAYSSGVPTLVTGYSVKSKGIARDIFHNEDHYVVGVEDMRNGDELLNAYLYIHREKASVIDKEIEYTNNAIIRIRDEYKRVFNILL